MPEPPDSSVPVSVIRGAVRYQPPSDGAAGATVALDVGAALSFGYRLTPVRSGISKVLPVSSSVSAIR